MGRLHLRLLGGFEARLASGEPIELASKKAEALLAYLALPLGKRHGREKLADLLWSGLGDEHARNSLRKALTALRKALAEVEPEALLADRETVALDPVAVEVDVVSFEHLIEDGAPEQLERGVALYRGELLEGFSLREPAYQEWLEGERRRFLDLVLQALSQLLAQGMAAGENTKAVATARRLLTLDPLHESAHRALMRLYALGGEREAALRQYQTLRDLLERELGIEPEAETDALVETIRDGRVAATKPDRGPDSDPPHAEERARREDEPRKSPATHWRRRASIAAAVVLLLAGGVVAWQRPWEPRVEPASEADMAFPLPSQPSIAILPFANLSDDPEQAYFADGLIDDLITDLAKIDGLFVISRNSTFTYKGKPVSVKQVAEDLGVRYVLEGSVRRSGDEVRINAQLVDALTGGHLWAERYDGSLADIFSFQDNVTRKIVAALAVNLTPEEETQQVKRGTDNLDAYDSFLRGLVYYYGDTPEDFAQGESFLKKAIELDPDYGRAYGVLAMLYRDTFSFNWQKALGMTYGEAYALTLEYLEKAKRFPTPAAYYVESALRYQGGRYEESIAAAERAIALGAKNPVGYFTMAKAMLYSGRPHEALDYANKAMRLDPQHVSDYFWPRAQALFNLERFEESAEVFEKIAKVIPDEPSAFNYLAASYAYLGRLDEAKENVKKAEAFENKRIWGSSVLDVIGLAFKNDADIERLRKGLRMAGLQELPHGFDTKLEYKVTGAELRELYFGREIYAREVESGKDRWITITHDGHVTNRGPPGAQTGTAWIDKDDHLCIYWNDWGRVCAGTFRNPEGTQEQRNEYFYVYSKGPMPFSPVN